MTPGASASVSAANEASLPRPLSGPAGLAQVGPHAACRVMALRSARADATTERQKLAFRLLAVANLLGLPAAAAPVRMCER